MSRDAERRGTLVLMALQALAALLICCVCAEQTAFAAGEQAQTPPQTTSSSEAATETVRVHAGTLVPLTLVSPIKSKSTKVGDAVRAVVAFPITVGAQVAIPAGTYVEGVVTSLTAQAKGTHQPEVQIHFTRLLYANGYTATLDAANTQAKVERPGSGAGDALSKAAYPVSDGAGRTRIAFYGGEGFVSRAQFPTQPAPTVQAPPQVGPSMAKVLGITWGVIASVIVTGIIFGRHHQANADYVLFDVGWQFQMALTSPLNVDAGQVASAAATPMH
jgi:hypothetical protein